MQLGDVECDTCISLASTSHVVVRHCTQVHRHNPCQMYDSRAHRYRLHAHAYTHAAQVIRVVRRARGPSARPPVAQPTDAIVPNATAPEAEAEPRADEAPIVVHAQRVHRCSKRGLARTHDVCVTLRDTSSSVHCTQGRCGAQWGARTSFASPRVTGTVEKR